MLMSPTQAALARRAILTAALVGTVALAGLQSALARDLPGADSVMLAYSDGPLPGEGRPPLPGPTDPDGPSY
jgi:hypothetical protein